MPIKNHETAAVLGSISELDTEWLRKVVADSVQSFTADEIVGEGYASRMYRLHLRYDGDSGLPANLILKLATLEAELTEISEDTLYREVYFYHDAGDELGDIVPTVYYADADRERVQLTLLMEDLGELPHKMFADSLENSCAAVKALARAHAVFWESPRLDDPVYAPVETQVDMASLIDVLTRSIAVEENADYSFPYLRRLAQHAIKLAPWMVEELNHVSGPHTMVHGDFHTRNVHIDHQRAILYDWQQAERGTPTRDLIYWILMCVDAEYIDEFEPVIVDTYIEAITAEGIKGYTRKTFNSAYRDIVTNMILRMYSFQVLINFTPEDQPYLQRMLARADHLARKNHLLAISRIARVLVPTVITVMRWIGLRRG